MNRTGIETATHSWQVATGCLHNCKERFGFDCWARRAAARSGAGFQPAFRLDRIEEPLKRRNAPALVAVAWMADLFGTWVDSSHIRRVLAMADVCRWHTFQFLTKNPGRLAEFNPWPPNCWVGASVPAESDLQGRPVLADTLAALAKVKGGVRFISFEPLVCPVRLPDHPLPIKWAIVGGLSGEKLKHEPLLSQRQYRASRISASLRDWGVPHYVKANLAMPCLPRDWPRGFTPPTRRNAE